MWETVVGGLWWKNNDASYILLHKIWETAIESFCNSSRLISLSSSAAAARNSGTSHSEELLCDVLTHTHTHTWIPLCALIYAAFNVFFISYFTSLWILFLGSWAAELVNTVIMCFCMVAVLLLLLSYTVYQNIHVHINMQKPTFIWK